VRTTALSVSAKMSGYSPSPNKLVKQSTDHQEHKV